MRHLRERAESVDYTEMLTLSEKEKKPRTKEDTAAKAGKPKKLKLKKKEDTHDDDEDFEEREPKKKTKKRPATSSHKDEAPVREPIKQTKKKTLTSSQLEDEDPVREPVKKKKKPLSSSQKDDEPVRAAIKKKKKKKPEDVKSEPIDVEALYGSVEHVAEPLTRKEYESMKKVRLRVLDWKDGSLLRHIVLVAEQVLELHKKEVELMMQKANAVSQEQKKTYEEIISELKAESESLSKKLKQKKQQEEKEADKNKAYDAVFLTHWMCWLCV